MAPSRRFIAIVALAAAAFTACSSNDAKESDIVDAMTDVGLTERQARCIGDGLTGELSQDELNDLASATDPDEFDDATSETVDSVLDECVSGETSDTSDTTGEDGSGSDTSDTTGEDGTDTTAG